ncbi:MULTISPECIES: septal ring lytic transglycosylase RlpA family protein [unclassified Lebetimonas]|uniref:septal ring lytic transglycosylase RlpA family protein n=1 Tax=unclassified Lebetimonas TaxID=2648158 RepID=UPI000465EFEF|nr:MULTISPECIES: septal ring lytic transglycosylase RlpA family protein [unclassified Lebetimonas]
MKKTVFLIGIILLIFTGCSEKEYETVVYPTPGAKKATQKAYAVNGNVYIPKKHVPIGWTQTGTASWYGPNFHGKYTSDGEIYNMYEYSAAHKTLPMNTMVKVTNLNNGRSVIVRINDRGPFVKGRIIDLSYAAAKKIGIDATGTAPVRVEVVGFKGKDYVNGYMIQIGAFQRYEGAEITAKKYKNLGYNTVIKTINGLNKVFITGFESYNEAKKFKLQNNINGFIVGD